MNISFKETPITNQLYSSAKELKDYLKLRKAEEYKDFFNNTKMLFSVNTNNEPLEHTLIRRFYMAGSYDIGFLMDENKWKEKRGVKRGSSLDYDKYWDHSLDIGVIRCIKEYYSYTLGRNDATSISKDTPLSRCRLPDFPQSVRNELNNISFIPYFERKEMAIRVNPNAFLDIRPKDIWKPIAFISLSLRHSTARLDFLVRLFKAFEVAKSPITNSNPQYIHEIYRLDKIVPNNMDVYLCDGWADILIIFHDPTFHNESSHEPYEENEITDRYKYIEEIFIFQNILFQDFQVDRTEIIPTPSCANIAMTKYVGKNSELEKRQLILNFNFRLLEDRYSVLKNAEFVKHVTKGLQKIYRLQTIKQFINEENQNQSFNQMSDGYLAIKYFVIMCINQLLDKLNYKDLEISDNKFEISAIEYLKRLFSHPTLEINLKDKLNKRKIDEKEFLENTIHLSRTPGRMDFSIRIQSYADLSHITYDEFLRHLNLSHSNGLSQKDEDAGHIDRLQTTLAYRYTNFVSDKKENEGQ